MKPDLWLHTMGTALAEPSSRRRTLNRSQLLAKRKAERQRRKKGRQ